MLFGRVKIIVPEKRAVDGRGRGALAICSLLGAQINLVIVNRNNLKRAPGSAIATATRRAAGRMTHGVPNK
jgi:hypothetical protein